MQLLSRTLIFLSLLTSAFPASASGALVCANLFSRADSALLGAPKRTSSDAILIEAPGLFPQLGTHLFRDKTGAVGILVGKRGFSGEVWEEAVDLTKVELVGVESSPAKWTEEGAALDLHVRLPSRRNDVFTVSLSSEMDAFAFLAATRLKLSTRVIDSVAAHGFVVRAGVATPTTETLIGLSSITIGRGWKIVGIETDRANIRAGAHAILHVQNTKTKEVYRVRSRTSPQGLKVLERAARGESLNLIIEGNRFADVPRGRPVTRSRP